MQATPAPTLRPLGVGDVLDKTFNVYRSRPLLFIGLSAIWYLLLVLFIIALIVVGVLGALATFAQGTNFTRTPPAGLVAGAVVGIIVFAIVAVIVTVLVVSAQSASLVQASATRYLGKDVSIGQAFRAGLSAAMRLFGASIIVVIVLALTWLVLFGVAGIIAAVSNSIGVSILVFVIAGIAAIVVTFYLGSSWLVAPVVVVVEKAGPVVALRRAWRLSEGNRWRIIGIQILLLVLNLVLTVLLAAVFGFTGPTQPGQFGMSDILQQLANLASTIVWLPVQWIAFTVLYYDLRVRKEAFDLQLAAEALPQS